MLRTLPQTRDYSLLQRLAAVAIFTLLTILTAKMRIDIGPIPITLQTLAVILAGTVLGARDGALSQIFYVGLIVLGFPFDSRSLGTAVFAAPTWGYLLAFIPCAFAAGWIVERFQKNAWIRLTAGVVGGAIVLSIGFVVFKQVANIPWEEAFTLGVAPFLGGDFIKALLVAAITEGTRAALLRVLSSEQP